MFHRPLAVLVTFLGFVASGPPATAVVASVHPFCVQYLMNVQDSRMQGVIDDPMPVTACNEHFKNAPIDIKDDYYSAEVKGIHNEKPYYRYKVVGMHRNATIVSVAENPGGANVYSAIGMIMGWPVSSSSDARDFFTQRMTLLGFVEGGDRCNGGFAEVKMTAPATLLVSTRLTPYDLFVYRPNRGLVRDKEKPVYVSVENEELGPVSMKLMELEPYRDLDTGATSCIGTATTEYNLDYGTAKLVSVKLDKLTSGAGVAKHKHQACFNKVVQEAAPSLPATITPEKLRAMSNAFESKCMAATP
ncbi:MAG: hypothetical protein FJX54_00240 [Alphaproteobacteria bacterium]|nr:hypothetical protein [Alphaproteobacteria bacterium]